MGPVAEDGVAHIVVVGGLNLVEKKAVFIFARIPDDTTLSDYDAAANEAAYAHFHVCAYPCGAVYFGVCG